MSRRNTELLLLIASAFPVILLYAMYVLTAGATISFETLAVPIGLFAAFAAAHIAVRILAPGARPRHPAHRLCALGIGITFVTRLAPDLAISQLIILFGLGGAHGGNARTGQEPRRGHALQVHLWHYRASSC